MLEANENYDEKFEYNPKISILVPVYNVLDRHLIPCIESVLNQVYTNWELCLADDCSSWDSVRETLAKYEGNEKIKIVYRTENGHISRCTNSALEIATGEFVAFMDCDDVLRPNALYEVVKKLNENPNLDFIYSDEDKIDDDGFNRHMPHFKPDWSPDTLMSHMYTCHFGVYRRSIANEIGGLRAGYEGAQDYDFTLRFTEKTNKIAHIDKILYHWRERKESTALDPSAKPYIFEAAKKSKEDALARRGLKANLEMVDIMYQYRVNYISQTNPLISVIIPSKDNYKVLKRCIETLYEITRYRNFEVILVDNGSNDENKKLYQGLADKYNFRYIYEKMNFNFSRMCNIGAKEAKGDYYLFLNDDIEIINEEWLERMVGHAELEHVGAVGAKLLYPNSKKIQHIGVINIANGPVHAFIGYNDDNIYYFGRNKIDYNWLVVTAACMLVNAAKFNKVNGFNEDMPVAYNDVELCFRLVEAGYYNVVRNDVILYHHESVSRGNDLKSEKKFKRLMAEQKHLYKLHPYFKNKDPFYSSNLTQHAPDFSYNMMKENRSASLFPKELVIESLKQSFVKLDPRTMFRNPIMFIVEVVTFVMLVVTVWSAAGGDTAQGSFGYNILVFIVLFLTLLFANFAEAIAEARGKAQADSLRKTREETPAKRVEASGKITTVSSSQLKKGRYLYLRGRRYDPFRRRDHRGAGFDRRECHNGRVGSGHPGSRRR